MTYYARYNSTFNFLDTLKSNPESSYPDKRREQRWISDHEDLRYIAVVDKLIIQRFVT